MDGIHTKSTRAKSPTEKKNEYGSIVSSKMSTNLEVWFWSYSVARRGSSS